MSFLTLVMSHSRNYEFYFPYCLYLVVYDCFFSNYLLTSAIHHYYGLTIEVAMQRWTAPFFLGPLDCPTVWCWMASGWAKWSGGSLPGLGSSAVCGRLSIPQLHTDMKLSLRDQAFSYIYSVDSVLSWAWRWWLGRVCSLCLCCLCWTGRHFSNNSILFVFMDSERLLSRDEKVCENLLLVCLVVTRAF